MTEAEFMAETQRLTAACPGLSPLGAGILAAMTLGIAQDSRSFARIFDISHALVLREAAVLDDEFGLLSGHLTGHRRMFQPTARAEALLHRS